MTNTLINNLKLITFLDKINIKDCDSEYKIELKETDEDMKPLWASIDKKTNKVIYYMSDLYNNGYENEEINIEDLKELSTIINAIKGN